MIIENNINEITLIFYCSNISKYPMDPLHRAVMDENIFTITNLISSGHPIDIRDDYGMTSLHIAVSNRYYDGVKELIEHGSDVNALDDFGHTPLMKCLDLQPFYEGVDYVGVSIASLLIKHGADVNVKYEGKTVFEYSKNSHFRNFLISAKN